MLSIHVAGFFENSGFLKSDFVVLIIVRHLELVPAAVCLHIFQEAGSHQCLLARLILGVYSPRIPSAKFENGDHVNKLHFLASYLT